MSTFERLMNKNKTKISDEDNRKLDKAEITDSSDSEYEEYLEKPIDYKNDVIDTPKIPKVEQKQKSIVIKKYYYQKPKPKPSKPTKSKKKKGRKTKIVYSESDTESDSDSETDSSESEDSEYEKEKEKARRLKQRKKMKKTKRKNKINKKIDNLTFKLVRF